jgi:DNA-binding XRE family transcriptional regulator
MKATIKASDLHAESMKNDSEYAAAYDSLEEEFALIDTLLRARKRARLTQAEVASRMGTTESAVSRLESGRARPSTRTLGKYAAATGYRVAIRLEPVKVS